MTTIVSGVSNAQLFDQSQSQEGTTIGESVCCGHQGTDGTLVGDAGSESFEEMLVTVNEKQEIEQVPGWEANSDGILDCYSSGLNQG